MNGHAALDYHKTALTKMEELLYRYRNPCETIHSKLHQEAQKLIKENQNVIESILKIVMICGKQGLALCGHHDDKIEWEESELDLENRGNFIELVRFRAETDMVLNRHLYSAPKMLITLRTN